MKGISANITLKLCVTAMFSAILVGGKEALAAIPNVEVVTLFVALCAYVWGLLVAMPAVFVFVAVDMAIWGINTWVLSYIVHWNVVALCFYLFAKLPFENKGFVASMSAVLAVVLTALFGVLTSFVDVIVGFSGGFFVDFDNVLPRFAVMYSAGVPFFVTHILSNALIFAVCFVPLVNVNRKAKLRLFGTP